MQRVGALVGATSVASDSRPAPLEGFGRAFIDALSYEVEVPAEAVDRVETYMKGLGGLWHRYGSSSGRVQVQDAWLSDPALPSPTGAVTAAAQNDVPQLAAALRLVRDHNYTLTDRGRTVRLLGAEAIASIRNRSWTPNPYLIGKGLGLFILYVILNADGDLMKASMKRVLEDAPFSFRRYGFAVSYLGPACDDLAREASRRVSSGAELREIQRLKELAKAIRETDRNKGKARSWGGGRTPDQAATVRLEPYVDLGLITKAERFEYEYRLTPQQTAFFQAFTHVDDMDSFLRTDVVRCYLTALGQPVESKPSPEEVWHLLVEAYRDMRSALGYAAFEEVALLAIGRLIDRGEGRYFEVSDGIEQIRAQQRQSPKTVQLTATRGGGLRYVRIIEERLGRVR